MRVYYSILKDFACKGRLKQLAFYLTIKDRTNSIIYNYNPHRLSKFTGLHHRTIKRYVNNLISMGYCELHKNNLTFKNQSRIIDKNDYLFKIETGAYQHILNQLYYSLIKNNYNQQFYNAAKKYSKNRNLIKRLNGQIKSEIFISSRSIGKLLGVSFVKANSIINKLSKNNVIRSEVRIKFIKRMTHKEFKLFIEYSKGFYLYKDNSCYLHQGRLLAI